ncbi:MAG: hypothetical protein K9K65_02545 [Desulfarculaceae bacterium]|nr:hypothetical protein [Desulfarculaceae bacterium]MCF8047186.1 hypothetical protein [Desulfarculaceae bacterium]MCF8096698.1 hypothetical protein [Desulfarculaceae bacterium]
MELSRSQSSLTQRLLSMAALGLLALVAAVVFWQQGRYDPASWGWGGASGAGAGMLAELAVPGLTPLGPGEGFTPATLSDKIDGKAELYLAAGFEGMVARRYALAGRPAAWLELMLYRMKNPRAAYSVFSNQRRSGAQDSSLTPNAYTTSNALYLAQGPYYLEAVASLPEPALKQGLTQAAQAILAKLPAAPSAAPAEAELFPAQGMKAGSVVLLAKDAFGMAGLDQMFIATYPQGGGELMAFLARRADPATAQKQAAAYAAFLKDNGGNPQPAPAEMPGAHLVEVFGAWELFWAQGPYLAGVRGGEDKAATLGLAQRLRQALEKAQS